MGKKVENIARARFRRQVRKRKIVLASQVEMGKFEADAIDEFLERIFGVTGGLVTDESRLSDFISFGNDPDESAQAVATIQAEYGIVVDVHDRLVEVLRRLK